MQTRPRNYGKLNRSIARATSYALREANRGYSKNTKYESNPSDTNYIVGFIAFLILLVVLGSCS